MRLSAAIALHAGGPGSGCRGPKCGRPSTGKKSELMHTLQKIGKLWGYDHVWARLGKKGHEGDTKTPFTKDELKMIKDLKQNHRCELGYCFMNAQRLAVDALSDPKIKYVEGLVTVHSVPIDHAWLEVNGKVWDPTLMKSPGVAKDGKEIGEYVGIEVPKEMITSHWLKAKTYSPLSHIRDEKIRKRIWGD